MNDTASTLPEWRMMLDSLGPVGDMLMTRWGRPAPSADDRRDMLRLALSAVANGYLSHIALDPGRPQWTPCWNLSMNMGGPCPDYTYRTTDVDPKGVYRISGYRPRGKHFRQADGQRSGRRDAWPQRLVQRSPQRGAAGGL